ncbi:GSCOCG00011628001-RA-CDS, partial [Cotesia congregata]
ENIKQDEVVEVFNGPVTRSFKARHKLKLQMNHLEEPLITNLKRKRSKTDEELTSKRPTVSLNLSTENQKLPFQYMNAQKMNEFLERIVECTEKWRTLQLEDLYFSLQTIMSKPTAD